MKRQLAQIATAMATFDGATVDLSKCMYTLESGSDSYTYKVKATGLQMETGFTLDQRHLLLPVFRM